MSRGEARPTTVHFSLHRFCRRTRDSVTSCGGAGTVDRVQVSSRTHRGNSEPGSHSFSAAGSDLESAPVTSRRTTLPIGGAGFQGAPPALRGAGRLDTVASCDRCRQSRSAPTQLPQKKKRSRRRRGGGCPAVPRGGNLCAEGAVLCGAECGAGAGCGGRARRLRT